jgi:tRNA(Ile)-lysidine synthase
MVNLEKSSLLANLSTPDLVTHIAQSWSPSMGSNITVGLSGGIDSVVLLYALHQITTSNNLLQLSAIHINHGISINANYWANFCQEICLNLNIPLAIKTCVLAKPGGESLENVARKARYNEFFACDDKVIALAHHQDDQVETTLSQLCRGSDLHNVAAMHMISHRNNKLIWRPLLDISRTQIEAYASAFDLKYITDESNADTKYLRNFIRHEVIPLLSEWDNQIKTKLLNFNAHLQDMLALTDEIAESDLKVCLLEGQFKNGFGIISLDKFSSFSHTRQLNLLAWFVKSSGLPLASSHQFDEFIRQAINSNYDKKPQLKLNLSHVIVKYKKQIFIENNHYTL